jgi:hypothetical protein
MRGSLWLRFCDQRSGYFRSLSRLLIGQKHVAFEPIHKRKEELSFCDWLDENKSKRCHGQSSVPLHVSPRQPSSCVLDSYYKQDDSDSGGAPHEEAIYLVQRSAKRPLCTKVQGSFIR